MRGRMLLESGLSSVLFMATSTALFSVTSFQDASAIRPFDGTDAAVTDEGTIELELGPLQWIRADGHDAATPSVTVNVGVAHDWEISAFARASWLIAESGGCPLALADDGLVLKRILREGSLQDRAGPSVAVEISPLLPATRPSDHFGARVTPVVSQTWKGVTGHLSTDLLWTREHEPGIDGALIIEGPEIGARIHPAMEATVGWERDHGRAWSGLAALLWAPRDDLEFDLGFWIGRSHGVTGREVRAGLTWQFRAWELPAD